MNNNKKAVMILLAAACTAGAAYQGTSAFMTDESKVVNELEFSGEKGLDALLEEPSWNPEKGIRMIPNTMAKKDPQITNTSQSPLDELAALRVEFVYTEDCPEGKEPGSLLSQADMDVAARVFHLDYNSDDPMLADWVRFEGEDGTNASQCFYYKETLRRNFPEEGDTTAPLFTSVRIEKEINSRQMEYIREIGGVAIRIRGLVLQQMEGEKRFGLNSPKEAYEAGLFDGLRETT